MKTIIKIGTVAMFLVVMTTCKSKPQPSIKGQYPTQIKAPKYPTA